MTTEHRANAQLPEVPDNSPCWSFHARAIASVLVMAHLAAVVAEPFHFFSRTQVRPSAMDARWLRQTLAPYVDFMYLSHGYFFFAPNPGPNHLIRCRITRRSSSGTNEAPSELTLQFPDKKLQKPRLLYHRHFMLSEFYNTLFTPPEVPPEALQDPIARSQWQADRDRYLRLQNDLKKNLAEKFPDHELQLERIEHLQPSEFQYFVDRWKLTDPRLYLVLPESIPEDANPSTNGSGPPSRDPKESSLDLIPINLPKRE